MKSSLHFNWFVIYEFQKIDQFKSNLIFSKIYDNITHPRCMITLIHLVATSSSWEENQESPDLRPRHGCPSEHCVCDQEHVELLHDDTDHDHHCPDPDSTCVSSTDHGNYNISGQKYLSGFIYDQLLGQCYDPIVR